jgi:protein disulfide isomerase family A protein 3
MKLYINRGPVLYFRDAVVLFRPKHLHNKFEPNAVEYEGPGKKEDIESWINKN